MQQLKFLALKKGGRDNITVILCEILEQPRNFLGRMLEWFCRQNEGDINEKQNAGS